MISVRKAQAVDAPALIALMNALNLHEGKPATKLLPEQLAAHLSAFLIAYVAENDAGEIIGYVLGYKGIQTESGETGYHVHDIYVLLAHRNGVAARKLAQRFATHVLDDCGTWMTWQVMEDNTATKRLYDRVGIIDPDICYYADRPRMERMARGEWRAILLES